MHFISDGAFSPFVTDLAAALSWLFFAPRESIFRSVSRPADAMKAASDERDRHALSASQSHSV